MAAFYTFEDLSGQIVASKSDNPYDGLLEACNNDPKQLQARYDVHRTTRNSQQREKLLSADFAGVTPDEILAKLHDPTIEPGFKDWRHCLVFWARPPEAVRTLIAEIQRRLREVVPNLWIMPQPCLHMTALEVTHSLTAAEIDDLASQILPSAQEITDYTHDHRARLVKPLVSYDAQALALSYLPAAGEVGRSLDEDNYTYHHLRRDLHHEVSETGVKVASRYVIPSAHLTVGRFITKSDLEDQDGKVDHVKMQELVQTIESINEWLEAEYWPSQDSIRAGGVWVVGQERGLDHRRGALWYGGGETIKIGKGF